METWGVRDFKSISLAEVRLDRALTLIAGANSSGKSSIFQSLLVLAQSVQGQTGVVLNGPLVRLGSGADVVRRGQSTCSFFATISVHRHGVAEPQRFQFEVTFGLSADSPDLVPTAITISGSGQVLLEATTARLNTLDARKIIEQSGLEGATPLRVTSSSSMLSRSRTYVLMQGFIPVGIATHVAENEVRFAYGRIADLFEEPAQRDLGLPLWALEREIRQYESVRDPGELDEPLGGSRQRRVARRELLSLPPQEFRALLTRLAKARYAENQYALLLADRRDLRRAGYPGVEISPVENSLELTLGPAMDVLGHIAEDLRDFANGIDYLGPLRDEPRVLHNAWDLRARSLPVGVRGELTAEVLTRHRDRIVRYTAPSGEESHSSLAVAVSAWCEHLGIGSAVKVVDHAKLGRSVELVVNGESRDLTSIGVGASQLLPVIVAVLMTTRRGRCLLIEQPELHLHPAVQAKLADFLLLASADQSVLVETHSEAMLTRLRRRVAEGSVVHDMPQVLFVENTAGVATSLELSIDEFGDMDVWPKGFFDDRIEESRRIAEAISRRLGAAAERP